MSQKRGVKSGKRLPSKRVITARNEMRSSFFNSEGEDDQLDWYKGRRMNGHYPHPLAASNAGTHHSIHSKLKRRHIDNK